MVKTSKIIATLGVAAGLGVALLPLASYAETGSKDVEVEIAPVFNFEVKSYKAASTTSEVAKVTMERGATNNELEHQIKADGNTANGYVLTMKADHAHLLGETTSKQIPSITGTSLPTAGKVAEGKHGWGYRTSTTAATSGSDLLGNYGDTYKAIPADTADTLRTADASARDNAFDETTFVNFGIVTATDEVADTYKATITYTATPSPAIN